MVWNIYPCAFSLYLDGSLTVRLVHPELILGCRVRLGSSFLLLRVDTQLPQHHLWAVCSSPLSGLGTPDENQLVVHVWVYSWTLCST